MAKAHGLQARGSIDRFAAKELAPEIEVFQHRQGGFQRVAVAEIMRLLRKREFRFAAFKCDRATGGRKQSCHQPEQR